MGVTMLGCFFNARQQFVCFSPFCSQTVLTFCVPQCFLHFSKVLHVCLFTFYIHHQPPGEIFNGDILIYFLWKSSDPWCSFHLVRMGCCICNCKGEGTQKVLPSKRCFCSWVKVSLLGVRAWAAE